MLCWAPCEAAPAAKLFVPPKSRMMLRTPDAKVPPSTKKCQHMMMQVIPRVAVAENFGPEKAGLLDRGDLKSASALLSVRLPAAGMGQKRPQSSEGGVRIRRRKSLNASQLSNMRSPAVA